MMIRRVGSRAQRGAQRTLNSRVVRRLASQPVAWLALLYLVGLCLAAVFAAQIAPYDPLKQDLLATSQAPNATYLLGTDQLGRDVLSRLLFGAQASLFAAFQAVGIALLLGVPLGLVAGYYGGWIDRIISWVVDVLYALPLLLVAMGLIAIIGSGLVNAMFAVGVALATSFIRLTRGIVLAEREELYVDSARIGGIAPFTILFRHLLPNLAPALIVQSALSLAVVILIESALSFLGLGLPVGQPSWGQMLADSRLYVRIQPFLPIPPGLAITLTGLAFNLVGDALRDAFGPGTLARPPRQVRRKAPDAPSMATNPEALLSVRGLTVRFPTPPEARSRDEDFALLEDISFDIYPGETFGLVGESGSGKTMTTAALMGMIPIPGVLTGGSVQFGGRELTTLRERDWQRLRGKEIGMIFQEPVTALNPVLQVGGQIDEPMRIHLGLTPQAARTRTLELLDLVGLPDPQTVYASYPHQLSGGMAQRAVIARALSCKPRLLIADEPTTALDVTIQGQILELLQSLQAHFGMAILLISHDLGVIAKMCQRTAVMYAGQIVEQGPTQALFSHPQHPYTLGLLATMPQNHAPGVLLPTIKGHVPPLHSVPQGCHFHPRCPYATAACRQTPIAMHDLGERSSRCIHIDQLPGHLKAAEYDATID